MDRAVKIFTDEISSLFFQESFESDIGGLGHHLIIGEENVDEFVAEFKKRLMESDYVETGFYCPGCCEIYETNNGQEECDDCLKPDEPEQEPIDYNI